MNDTVHTIPAGYMQNAAGHLVPVAQVRESDKLRDALVHELALQGLALNQALAAYKRRAMDDIASLISLSAEKYGIQLGGKKGNVQLHSYDGQYRIERVQAQNIAFTEELQAAKALVERCILAWSESANSNLRAVVMRAFKPNTKGELRTSAVLDLLRLEIDDADWQAAMTALKDSIQVNGATTYIRIYQRAGSSDQYRMIPLDLSGVRA